MVNEVTMTHASVNSGTAVKLKSPGVTFSFKTLRDVTPITGKYDIVESSFNGIENPKLTISGHFDVDDISSNELTQELLTEFCMLRSTTPISLSVPLGATPTYLKGRPTNGYETDGNMTLLNTIKIVIDTFDIIVSGLDSDRARFVNYNITCHETL